jgi:hypothetical protein
MQQVLKAWDNPMGMKDLCVAMDALRKALEQPEQGPSQWRDMVVVNLVREGINKHKARDLADHFATTPPAAQPEQRKPLTMDEIGQPWAVADGEHNASASVKRRITRAIEAAHGIKEGTWHTKK